MSRRTTNKDSVSENRSAKKMGVYKNKNANSWKYCESIEIRLFTAYG